MIPDENGHLWGDMCEAETNAMIADAKRYRFLRALDKPALLDFLHERIDGELDAWATDDIERLIDDAIADDVDKYGDSFYKRPAKPEPFVCRCAGEEGLLCRKWCRSKECAP